MMQRALTATVMTTGCPYGDKKGYDKLLAYLESLKTWTRKMSASTSPRSTSAAFRRRSIDPLIADFVANLDRINALAETRRASSGGSRARATTPPTSGPTPTTR